MGGKVHESEVNSAVEEKNWTSEDRLQKTFS